MGSTGGGARGVAGERSGWVWLVAGKTGGKPRLGWSDQRVDASSRERDREADGFGWSRPLLLSPVRHRSVCADCRLLRAGQSSEMAPVEGEQEARRRGSWWGSVLAGLPGLGSRIPVVFPNRVGWEGGGLTG